MDIDSAGVPQDTAEDEVYKNEDLKKSPPKSGFFNRLRSFFGVRKRKTYAVSRFAHMLDGISKKHPEYARAKKAVALCDDAIDIVTQRLSMVEQLKSTETVLRELDYYENITDDDAKYMKELLSRLKSLTKDKAELKSQIAVFDPNLARMGELESDAVAIAPEMKEAERNQRMFRHDIHALRGEKSELEEEREDLIKGERFVRRFMTGVLLFFVLCVTIIGFSGVTAGTAIAVPISVLTILVIVITALLVGYRRRLRFELSMNLKKQKKAVGLLNKKNAVFAHYTNFLNFTYRKYSVRSSDTLKKRLKDFDHYKHLTRRYDALRKLGDETEKDLDQLLRRLKIPVSVLPLDNFARVFNVDEKRETYKNAVNRKTSVEKTLRILDDRQAQVWDQLTFLNRVENGIVDRMIKFYMEEAGKLILR